MPRERECVRSVVVGCLREVEGSTVPCRLMGCGPSATLYSHHQPVKRRSVKELARFPRSWPRTHVRPCYHPRVRHDRNAPDRDSTESRSSAGLADGHYGSLREGSCHNRTRFRILIADTSLDSDSRIPAHAMRRVLVAPAPLKEIEHVYGPILRGAGFAIEYPPRDQRRDRMQMTEDELLDAAARLRRDPGRAASRTPAP